MRSNKDKTGEVGIMSTLLQNYHHERHFLQNIHVSNANTSKVPFVYVKNHKAACTTILSTTLHNQQTFLNLPPEQISSDMIHKPPKKFMRNGKRTLTVESALAAINDTAYFKFTFVREPLSRLLSAFLDKVSMQTKQRAALFKHVGMQMDEELSLSKFIDIISQDSAARDLDRHWRSQTKEISYSEIEYDFIGTVADIQIGLPYVMKRIFGSDAASIQDTRKTIGHKTNSSALLNELSKADIKKVETIYHDDFEMYARVVKALSNE